MCAKPTSTFISTASFFFVAISRKKNRIVQLFSSDFPSTRSNGRSVSDEKMSCEDIHLVVHFVRHFRQVCLPRRTLMQYVKYDTSRASCSLKIRSTSTYLISNGDQINAYFHRVAAARFLRWRNFRNFLSKAWGNFEMVGVFFSKEFSRDFTRKIFSKWDEIFFIFFSGIKTAKKNDELFDFEALSISQFLIDSHRLSFTDREPFSYKLVKNHHIRRNTQVHQTTILSIFT